MPAQRKYPDKLRERAVKMVLEIRQREGKGHGELARVAASWVFTPRRCVGGSSRPRSTMARGRAPRPMISGVSGSWNAKSVSSVAPMRY
jgi:hypothetical protein